MKRESWSRLDIDRSIERERERETERDQIGIWNWKWRGEVREREGESGAYREKSGALINYQGFNWSGFGYNMDPIRLQSMNPRRRLKRNFI